jgi:uncharacterized OB-fold protein
VIILKEFIECLKKGEFKIPVCPSCKSKTWPPSHYCPHCLNKTSLQKVRTIGTLIEFTKSHIKDKEGIFGIVEMSGIKIVGSLDIQDLKEGMKVKMSRCGVSQEGTVFYNFTKA